MNLLGVNLGDEEHLLGSQPDNPKGYGEYQPILELNDEILERLGGSFHEPPPLPPVRRQPPSLRIFAGGRGISSLARSPRVIGAGRTHAPV